MIDAPECRASSWRHAVEQSLSSRWNGDVVLEQDEQAGLSGREHVHRFHVRVAPPDSPSSVVVKQPRQRDEGLALFFNEWACLQLLTELCPTPPAPRLYVSSPDPRFLVMEDLGTGSRLDHALLGTDAERATQTLVALFETIGQMHAATFGHRARFDAIFEQLARRPPHRDDRAQQRRQGAIEDALNRLALSPHGRFFDELAEIGRRVESSEREVLIHGDPCPDNCQWVGDRVRLLDFEHGRFGNAFSDACYPLIHFPTCWCLGRLPERVIEQAMEAYRRTLAHGMAHAADEQQFARGMTDASILWAWSMFASWHMPDALSQDREWGRATVRQRILFRFRLVVEMLERHGWYPSIADTTRRSHELLSARWKNVADIPLYPAFR